MLNTEAGNVARTRMERSMLGREGSDGGSLRIADDTNLSSFDSTVGEQTMSRIGGPSYLMEWAARVNSSAAPMNGGDRKRVMVVVDRSREARLAMLWALSHIVHGADILSLILFVPSSPSQHQKPMSAAAVASASSSLSNSGGLLGRFQMPQEGRSKERKEQRSISELLASLKSLCASRRPEVEVEAMPVEGLDKGMTIVSQARKFEANVLVLGQKKRSLLQRLFNHKTPVEDVTDYCIKNAECLTLAVRKKGKHMGGYLINSRWQKNFWLLA